MDEPNEERDDEPQPMIDYAAWIQWRDRANAEIFDQTLREVVKLLREMCAPPTRH